MTSLCCTRKSRSGITRSGVAGRGRRPQPFSNGPSTGIPIRESPCLRSSWATQASLLDGLVCRYQRSYGRFFPAIEVGWRLGDRYRGRGYATEAGSAWVSYGFEQLGLDRIVSIYEPHNAASGAVMRRLGFTLERETTHPAGGVPLHMTSLARTAWLAR
jgi:hypothetical protein